MDLRIRIGEPPFHFPCIVAGRVLDRQERIVVSYPFTGEPVGSVPRLGPDDVVRAIRAAAARPPPLTRYERSRVLSAAADRIEREAEAVARLVTWESGLCLRDTRHEVSRTLSVLRFAAMEALRDDGELFSFDVSPDGRRRRGFTTREPMSAITAITPFNHPLNQVAHKVAPCVAAGSSMVIKPSERTPLAGIYLVAVLHEAGLPPGMINVVTGDPEAIGPVLVTHPDVRLVAFTGGVEVGKRIAERLGYRRALLELGGNDPLIVMDDADLDQAVRLAATGAFASSGQRCTAVKRILVAESIADAFAARLVEAAAAIRVGDPMDDETDMGTVISEAAAIRLEEAANRTIEDGARLLYGNVRLGAAYGPTVLDDVRPNSESVQRETFGPHAPILRVRDADDAIRVANATPFGLSAGVCTNDLRLALRLSRELCCGTVNIGEVPGYRSEASPFGGIKDSGLGVKEGVIHAMRAMTDLKLCTIPW